MKNHVLEYKSSAREARSEALALTDARMLKKKRQVIWNSYNFTGHITAKIRLAHGPGQQRRRIHKNAHSVFTAGRRSIKTD